MKKVIRFLIFAIFLSCGDTKNPSEIKVYLNSFNRKPAPLFVLDGILVSTIDSVSPSSIVNIYVLKEQKAIDKYGQKGKNGVIEIFTKNE